MSNYDRPNVFKGWTKPGPKVPGGVEKEAGETLDALAGNFFIFQYENGHRFSTDDLLTAWYGTQWAPTVHTALDLGSGIGSVGMTVAWKCPGARMVTVEAQDISVKLARKSARYNGIEHRYDIRHGDFRDPGILAPEEKFDLVTGSPPYFPLGTGILSDHPQKIACRFEVRGSVVDYAQVAARHLAPGGVFACVFPHIQNERVEEGARAADLAIVRRREIVFKEGEPPLLSLYVMSRNQDLPEGFRKQTWVEPPLIVRLKDGKPHPEYQAIKLSVGFPP